MNMFLKVCDTFVPHARNNYIPLAVSRKSLSIYAGFMVAVKLLTLVSLNFLPHGKAVASEVSSANILELTNYSRSVFGQEPLQLSTVLTKAAQAKALDMLDSQYFSHNSPTGKTPWDFIKAQGYNYIVAGENLALNFSTAEGVEKAWMNSAGHKANILNKDFKEIGIGIANGTYKGQQTTMIVQLFGTSIDQPFAPKQTYTVPQRAISAPVSQAFVPTPKKISLQAPLFDTSSFSLSNTAEYEVSGYAPGAHSVYILVNREPQAKMEVIQGRFSGKLELAEGKNLINAVSFNNLEESSAVSDTLTVQVDTVSPSVGTAQITPVTEDGIQYYQVEVQASADAAKIVASINEQNVMLQPGTDPTVWVGRFALSPQQVVSGKMMVSAYDLAGNALPTEVASIAPTLEQNFDPARAVAESAKAFSKELTEGKYSTIYLYLTLFLLGSLMVTIAVKRHVQHLGLIAHTSALAMIAMVFWVT